MNAEKKFKILSSKIKILKKELEITDDIMQDAINDFSEAVASKQEQQEKPKTIIVSKKPEPEEPNRESSNEEPPIPITPKDYDEDQRKLFKKIALQTHPDRLSNKPQFEKQVKELLFERARSAISNNDYFSLVEVADELDIEVPKPTKKHVEILKETLSDLESKLNIIRSSFPWAWYHEEDENKKETLISRYLIHAHNLGSV